MKYKHLFGPVHSRRLGFSLGVDLVPFKYCPLNCVYCEIYSTDHLTLERQEFFPVEEILAELRHFLADGPKLDYITFSGAGEPTLHSRIGEIIRIIKEEFPQYQLALLTNGVLLDDAELRKEILPCDLILPSLDACRQESFEKINQPHPGLTAQKLVEALSALRVEFSGQIWLEVFIIEGINDTPEELDCLAPAIAKIKPDLVQLNSLDRPGSEEWVEAAGETVLNRVKKYLVERLEMPVEIIAKSHPQNFETHVPQDIGEAMKATLMRRPSTAEDLYQTLGLHINEISKFLRQLNLEGKVDIKREERGVFYSWKH